MGVRNSKTARLTVSLLVVILLAGATSCSADNEAKPSQSTTSAPPHHPLRVGAWLPYWDDGTALQGFITNAAHFHEIHPFVYETSSATAIALQGTSTKLEAVVAAARSANVAIVPTVTSVMKPGPFLALLRDEQLRATHAAAICGIATDNDYDGIDMNYEQFAVTPHRDLITELAQRFVLLVEAVATCLHASQKRLEVTVMARTDDSMFADYRPKLAVGVYDYSALAKHADVVRPMAYDRNYPGGIAGSVDPIDWVRAVVSYSVAHIPPNRLELGIPLYGQDWAGTGADVVSAKRGPKLAADKGVTAVRDSFSATLTFSYDEGGKHHEVWYDDAEATMRRVDLARDAQLHGVSFWALGYEASDFWKRLSDDN